MSVGGFGQELIRKGNSMCFEGEGVINEAVANKRGGPFGELGEVVGGRGGEFYFFII